MNRIRPLSPLEKGHLKNHLDKRQGCWTALGVLEYPEELSQNPERVHLFKRKVQIGAAELVKKHPMLGMVIVDAATDPWFAKLASIDIEKLINVRNDTTDYEYPLYEGINRQYDFDDHTVPPWSIELYDRLDCKPHLGIAVTIPLVLGDGYSAKNMLHDLIESLPDTDDENLSSVVPSSELPLQPAYEDRSGNHCRKTLLDRVRELVFGPKRYGRPEKTDNLWLGFNTAFDGDNATLTAGCFLRASVVEDWDAVTNAAKKHGITPQAAFQAAALKILAGFPGVSGRDIMCRTPVNLRNETNDKKEVGNMSGIFSRVWTSAKDLNLDFWSFAARFQKEFDASGPSEAAKTLYVPTFNLGKYPEDYKSRWDKEQDQARENKQVTYAMVADFGEFEAKTSAGWRVHRVHISQGAALFHKPFTVALVSVRGRATISVGWQQEALDRASIFMYHTSIANMLQEEAA
ncbi:hypothetical protein BX666DRAFT_1939968 [Dichotomocladium elegans]|nr:hypothetical protein BX666DRAFT_1939968 [Dichotomocladium elegans]